ncbi:M3 family metallopeptidase [Pontixanthobacter aestiaquae]|uniref:Dipeptidyl carboxypeptidase II n=1 Tax=Pontixanthobacter aestiaquae TaxID=1509367 RepID=A0A844Z8V2_9SPHN|nr:M3 family metallopeptidase [Pontixanthobacter aestiaquae]MDN3645076.1 M3 family metallopeptidase [Pontixanthobacter aestiaquae]MXO83924.1 dipeptidyl carboxypeptidase II [Pontixanthobacter aestiaquae]
MKTQLMVAVAASALLAGCAANMTEEVASANEATAEAVVIPEGTGYFASDSTLPFLAPDFTKISEADYMPAFEQSMAIQKAEVQAIINNPAAPTFDNTIVELEKSGRMLGRVARVFFQLTGTNTTDGLDAINTEISPKLSEHSDSITLNPDLFARVKAIYDMRASLNLSVEDSKLLENTYDSMVHAGALLTDDQREKVKAINTKLSTLTTEFSQTARSAMSDQPLVVDTAEELAGLSEADIKAAADFAASKGYPGKYAIALQNTTQQPMLPSLENRATREKLFKLSYNRADGTTDIDTRLLIARIAALRADKAALFGQPDWASYTMYDRMAKTPKTALDFMEQMVPALAATQRREAALLNDMIKADGGDYDVKPWDWYRYANKVKAERYELDEDAVMEYFQLDKVLEDGIFHMAEKLYGLTFERRTDLPVYHPDVWVYTVFEADGSELGVFYFDPFQRPSKRGGAWMSNFVDQSYLWDTKPVIYNVLNVPKAPEGEVQLVSFDWVNTAFHEFGHALHGFFADQKYESLSGTATARDFVEYPSQVHEMWATWPSVLSNYAKHYETGETIPAELIEKIEAAAKFNQGYDFGEVVAAALLDMKWSALSPAEARALDTVEKVDAFEREALSELGLEVDLVPPRYRGTYFSHIFSSPAGYSAGYYSYLWTEMLDRDSRKWFVDNGGLSRKNGDHYRKTVLSRGGTMDYFDMFENFAGRQPDVTPMLEARGLIGGGDEAADSEVSDGKLPAGTVGE